MSSPLRRALAFLPLALAGGGLLAEVAGWDGGVGVYPWILPFFLVCLAVVAGLARRRGGSAVLVASLRTWCGLAPLAVLAPWVVVPGHLGVGYGGLWFFLGWVSRYPTFHGVNHEVVLGIACVLACAVLPPVFAACLPGRPDRGPWLATGVFVAFGFAWVPVFVRLDLEQVLYAGVVLLHGPLTLLGDAPVSLPRRLVIAAAAVGALVRLATLPAMAILLLRAWLPAPAARA